jgi:hypothetical protein
MGFWGLEKDLQMILQQTKWFFAWKPNKAVISTMKLSSTRVKITRGFFWMDLSAYGNILFPISYIFIQKNNG